MFHYMPTRQPTCQVSPQHVSIRVSDVTTRHVPTIDPCVDSLTHVIMQNPKIIHISCHGSYDQVDDGKQFYLSIEADNGLEMKLTQQDLNSIMGNFEGNNHVQLAVVSAC